MSLPLPMPDLNESTEAELRRVTAELGSALSHINRLKADNEALRAELARIQPTEGATPA